METGKKDLAKAVEEELFKCGKFTYFLGISNEILDVGVDLNNKTLSKVHHLRQLGEMAHVLTDSGLMLITSISDVDEYELDMLKKLNHPNQTIVINVGESQFSEGYVELNLEKINNTESLQQSTEKVVTLLKQSTILDPEYLI